jgi:hypothetical protein
MMSFPKVTQFLANTRKHIGRIFRRRHTVFLFGAGASAFCQKYDCPPVGNKLFAKLRKHGGVAAILSNQLTSVFNRNFEDGVEQVWDTHSEYLVGILRETALYLAQFEPGPDNLYRQLVRHLIGTRTRAVLATINYDLLIELAVCAEGRKVTYHTFPVSWGNIPVIKIHGSINFLPQVSIRDIGFAIGRGNTILEGAKISVAKSPSEVIDWCLLETGIAPAMALYTKKKPVLICPDVVRFQMGQWFRALEEAKRVYVIGVHPNPDDHHIWDVLGSCRAEFFYVGPEGDQVLAWAKARGRTVVHFAKTFEEAVSRLTR